MPDIYGDMIGRNATESQRLDEQLELWNRNIGYLLHPSITSKLSRSPVIADIGTGTGLFLSKLAKIYPEATLNGFDISQEQYPMPETLPSNVKLGIMDIKQPPPLEEHNRYDVVHVRLLVAAMNPPEWQTAVSNLIRLLKPGGALQWDEANFGGTMHLKGEPSSTISTIRFLGSLMGEALKERFSHGWNTLPHIMGSAGLIGVDKDVVSSDRVAETRKALTTDGTTALFAWLELMLKHGMSGSVPMEELKRLEDQAQEDISSGCYVRYDIHIALGFKPE